MQMAHGVLQHLVGGRRRTPGEQVANDRTWPAADCAGSVSAIWSAGDESRGPAEENSSSSVASSVPSDSATAEGGLICQQFDREDEVDVGRPATVDDHQHDLHREVCGSGL